jgi:hypothetical protein
VTSPIEEHNAHMAACVARQRRVEEPWLQALPLEACMAVSPNCDEQCYREAGHTGPHSWQPGGDRVARW